MINEKTNNLYDERRRREILITIAVLCSGDWNKIWKSIEERALPSDEEIDNVMNNLRCEAVTLLDEDYPQALKEVRKPPFVIFYYGDISLINNRNNCLSVVGTRHPSTFGLRATKSIIQGLREDIVIVSGMAIGIDTAAHFAALESEHKTVAVLGSGINVCYPSSNEDLYELLKEKCLVMSEYPPDVLPVQDQFPVRNRIVAGLSKCLLVTEAKRRSGTTTTIAFALEANRDVLCVPSNDLDDSACNLCIKDGGFLVENSDDVNMFY